MSPSPPSSLLVLGRQPELGLAELECLYGADRLHEISSNIAALSLSPAEINFERLGGSIKLAQLLVKLEARDWASLENFLIRELPKQLQHEPSGKFTLGVSVHGYDISPQKINKSLLKIKSALKSRRPIRIVPNKTSELSSAQVIHNYLTSARGWELIIVKSAGEIFVAKTIKVQDIRSYGDRDQARPKRDARVGMLPPKLAQIIINLASPKPGAVILDPFCGTGVVLQEALLMDYSAIGSDIDQRMVEYSKENLEWLRALRPEIATDAQVEIGDATSYTWPASIDVVASEVYLGRPLNSLPSKPDLEKIINDANTIISKFLKNLSPQLRSGTRLCLAVPAWRSGSEYIKLPLIAKLTDMGYNFRQFQRADASRLIYSREGQTVGRQLLALEKI